MRIRLSDRETHFHDELTGITLSRLQEGAILETDLPNEEIKEFVLNPITRVVEKNVSNLSGIRKAIKYGILILDDNKPAMPIIDNEEHQIISTAIIPKSRDEKHEAFALEQAVEILSEPVNSAKIKIRTITDLRILDALTNEEMKRKKPRRSLLDVIEQRKRSKDVSGVGLVTEFDDE